MAEGGKGGCWLNVLDLTGWDYKATHSLRLTSVGPLFLVAARSLFCVWLAYLLHELDQRQEQGNHDTTDDDRQENNHDGLQQRGHGRDGIVHFIIIVVSDLHQHLGQGA